MEHFDNQHLDYDQKSDEVKAYTNEIMLTMRDMLKLNPLYKVFYWISLSVGAIPYSQLEIMLRFVSFN